MLLRVRKDLRASMEIKEKKGKMVLQEGRYGSPQSMRMNGTPVFRDKAGILRNDVDTRSMTGLLPIQ